jgi:hypothetical protein
MKAVFAPSLLLVLTLAVSASLVSAQSGKVGTFDSQSILIAFYGSPLWAAELKAKSLELEQARRANDRKKIDELQRWGFDSQELAHKQFAGEAPLTNIMEILKPVLASVAARAHVATVRPRLESDKSSVQTVDVTALLLDELEASPRTRQIIQELQKSRTSTTGETGHPAAERKDKE